MWNNIIDKDKMYEICPEYIYEKPPNFRFKDLTGQKIGRLKVLYRTTDMFRGKTKRRKARWVCECDCGNICWVISDSLNAKTTLSCGCLNNEIVSKNNKIYKKKYNEYNLSGDYGIGYTFKNEEFLFDKEDYEKIKGYCWCVDTTGYVVSNDFNNNFKSIRLSRLIMDCDQYEQKVDHINHNLLDNRKKNLRVAKNEENCKNRKRQYNNTSGYPGVSKYHNKWMVRININKKETILGYYNDINDAIRIRKEAEEKYYKEFSYPNSINMNKEI